MHLSKGAVKEFWLVAALACFESVRAADAPPVPAGQWWNAAVESRRAEAGRNSAELARALAEVAPAQREGLEFLLENMSVADLQSLSAPFLLTNIALAYEAWEKAPWRSQVSKELFLNDVLPYASLNEPRNGR